MFTSFAGWVLKWLSGGVVDRILDTIQGNTDARSQVLRSWLEGEKAARDKVAEVRIATAGFAEMRLVTFLIAFPLALHLTAVIFDSIFHFGWKIARLPAPMDEWQGTIILSFFGVYAGFRVLSALIAAFVGKR